MSDETIHSASVAAVSLHDRELDSALRTRTILLVERCLLGLLLVGLIGLLAELLLTGHYEDWRQFLPLLTIGLTLVAAAWHATTTSRWSRRLFRSSVVLLMIAGITGQVLHVRANLEFQREIDPAQSSWSQFGKALRATTPPALAPGALVQLGLLGLLYSYAKTQTVRHRTGPGG